VTAATPLRVALITVVPEVASGYIQFLPRLGHEVPVVVAADRRDDDEPLRAAVPDEIDVVYPERPAGIAPLLRQYACDVGLCTGYPWRVPADALTATRLGIVNGHPSLLPRYRGPFPVAWAVRNGETEIGLSYHLMDADFDTGPVLAQTPIPLGEDDDWPALQAKLAGAVTRALPLALDRLARGDRGDVQSGGEYQSHFGEDYLHVDLTQPRADVHRQVRAWAFVPDRIEPHGAILERGGERLRLVRTSLHEVPGAERIECADGPLWVVESAYEGSAKPTDRTAAGSRPSSSA
jgi:methionyl-tRNA formyltransferase